jgi:hypothetical protein
VTSRPIWPHNCRPRSAIKQRRRGRTAMSRSTIQPPEAGGKGAPPKREKLWQPPKEKLWKICEFLETCVVRPEKLEDAEVRSAVENATPVSPANMDDIQRLLQSDSLGANLRRAYARAAVTWNCYYSDVPDPHQSAIVEAASIAKFMSLAADSISSAVELYEANRPALDAHFRILADSIPGNPSPLANPAQIFDTAKHAAEGIKSAANCSSPIDDNDDWQGFVNDLVRTLRTILVKPRGKNSAEKKPLSCERVGKCLGMSKGAVEQLLLRVGKPNRQPKT